MHPKTYIIIAVLVVLTAHAGLAVLGFTPAFNGELADADGYMRLNRVLDLYRTGNWYESIWFASNAPYGETLHWTRPLDALLYAGAWTGSWVGSWAGAPFGDFRSALFAWAVVISPLMQVASVLLLSWMTRPYISGPGFILVVALFVMQPGIANYFMLSRPDHHALMGLLFIAQLAVISRVMGGHTRPGWMFAAGLLGGLAVWVSVESLLLVLSGCAGLGLVWLLRGGDHGKRLAGYVVGVAVAVSVGLLVERSFGDLGVVEYDRLSVVHWTLLSALAATWAVLVRRPGGLSVRVLLTGVGVAVPFAVLIAAFPEILSGTIVKQPDEVLAFFDTGEFASLLPGTATGRFLLVQHLGPVLLVIPFLVYRVWHGDEPARDRALLYLAGIGVFIVPAVMQERWTAYVQMLFVVPWVELIGALWLGAGVWRIRALVIPMRAPAVVGALVLPAIASAALIQPQITVMYGAPPTCDWRQMHNYLQDQGPDGRILLTHIFPGVGLVYGTDYAIVGSPYHRNTEGILDTRRIFAAQNDAEARAIVNQRHIDLMLICPSASGAPWLQGAGGEKSLYQRMAGSKPPSWLVPIALPDHLAEDFFLYRVGAKNNN